MLHLANVGSFLWQWHLMESIQLICLFSRQQTTLNAFYADLHWYPSPSHLHISERLIHIVCSLDSFVLLHLILLGSQHELRSVILCLVHSVNLHSKLNWCPHILDWLGIQARVVKLQKCRVNIKKDTLAASLLLLRSCCCNWVYLLLVVLAFSFIRTVISTVNVIAIILCDHWALALVNQLYILLLVFFKLWCIFWEGFRSLIFFLSL